MAIHNGFAYVGGRVVDNPVLAEQKPDIGLSRAIFGQVFERQNEITI
jgi:hypothetical protein